MQIPSYQIHNVLKVYCRQLCRDNRENLFNDLDNNPSFNGVNISVREKMQTMLNKIVNDIITKLNSQSVSGVNPSYPRGNRPYPGDRFSDKETSENRFVYNVIDDDNNKQTHILSIENSSFLIKNPENENNSTMLPDLDHY